MRHIKLVLEVADFNKLSKKKKDFEAEMKEGYSWEAFILEAVKCH